MEEEKGGSDSSTVEELLDSVFRDAKTYYEVFGVKVDATSGQIKKAYYVLALRYHPDRVGKQEGLTEVKAKVNFQELTRIYEVLSDPQKRTIYDKTGSDDMDITSFSDFSSRDWENLWRSLYKNITQEDIEEFSREYKGSEQEKNDVIKEYVSSHGDLEAMMEKIILADWNKDVHRFIQIIDSEIASKNVDRFKIWNKKQLKKITQSNIKKMDSEAVEAEQMLKEIKKNTKKTTNKRRTTKNSNRSGHKAKGEEEEEEQEEIDPDLTKMILQRNQTRASKFNDTINKLERRYGDTSKQEEDKEYGDMDDLKSMIQGRTQQRKNKFNDIIGHIEKKYTNTSSATNGGSSSSSGEKNKTDKGKRTNPYKGQSKTEKQRSAKRNKK